MASHKPDPKQIVTTLMKFSGTVTRVVTEKGGGSVSKDFLEYICPKESCKKKISFRAKSGFVNPYNHLRTCYFKGLSATDADRRMKELYNDAVDAMTANGGTIRSKFKTITMNEHEKGIYAYLRYLILNNVPIAHIESMELRHLSRFKARISQEHLVKIILALVELVELKIGIEIQDKKGALMYDGWECRGTHYIGVFLLYTGSQEVIKNKIVVEEHVVRSTLISLAPMTQECVGSDSNSDDDNDQSDIEFDESDEATKFNAEAHLNFFRTIFIYYKQVFDQWVICLIGDNVAVNIRTSRLAGKPHVGCASHRLNLEVQAMVRKNKDMSGVIDSVHEIMKMAKRLKNQAILRNLTDLKPMLHNKTRWSSKCEMLHRFLEIRPQIISAKDHEDSTITDTDEMLISAKPKKYAAMLKEINWVAKRLQTKKFKSAGLSRIP